MTGTVEEAIRVGADAVSFHINVGSDHEPDQLSELSEVTETAERFGIPVLAMAYARGPGVDPEDPQALGHAVRLAEELGADIVKTGYSGDAESFQHVVESTRLPVVIAGGSKGSDRQTIEMVRGVMDAGGAGVSMGRSIFQHEEPGRSLERSPASSTTISRPTRHWPKRDWHSRCRADGPVFSVAGCLSALRAAVGSFSDSAYRDGRRGRRSGAIARRWRDRRRGERVRRERGRRPPRRPSSVRRPFRRGPSRP